jgi:malate permease and related proteins
MPFFTTEIGEVLLPVLRLFGFTFAGFLVFKINPVRKILLGPFVWIMLNIVFPLYFIHLLPTQWKAGAESGWIWAGIFFGAYLVFLAIQYLAARLLINRVPLMKTEFPREMLVIFSMHNAGYIPMPIIVALAPAVVSLYLSFYIMAFVILFFTVAVWIIQGAAGNRPRFTLNGPTVGIALGLIVALGGFYSDLPGWAQVPFRFASSIALDGVMVVLGGILASIPTKALRFRREFGGYILFKMILFPAVVLGVLAFIPLRGLPPEVAAGIKLAMVLEAAVPPATNIMVITRAYGSDKQVEYAGSAIITAYVAGLILLPLFLVLSRLVFS